MTLLVASFCYRELFYQLKEAAMAVSTIAVFFAMMTGVPCAAIDNRSNTFAWKVPGEPTRVGRYVDRGNGLMFSPTLPFSQARALRALRKAEAALQVGPPGPKVRVGCDR